MAKVSLPIIRYECEPGCGACCRHLIIEIESIDILREPKLKEVAKPFRRSYSKDENGVDIEENYDEIDEDTEENLGELVPGWDQGAMLAAGTKDTPCAMLTCEGMCSIYATRPNACLMFRAGSIRCQNARESAGLAPLRPVA